MNYFRAVAETDETIKAGLTEQLEEATKLILKQVALFMQSDDLEVQERSVTLNECVKYAHKKREAGTVPHQIQSTNNQERSTKVTIVNPCAFPS
jgi:Zn ribbon nucleic-acid-binding protein